MSNGAERKAQAHNAIIENREKIMFSGVLDVISFDETELEISTSLGELTIRGQMLNIESLNRDTGEMLVTGKIDELAYFDKKPESKGFIKRIFS